MKTAMILAGMMLVVIYLTVASAIIYWDSIHPKGFWHGSTYLLFTVGWYAYPVWKWYVKMWRQL